MTTSFTKMKCKECGEEIIKIKLGGIALYRPRRMSYCKGYHLNAYNPKTKICKIVCESIVGHQEKDND